MTVHDPYDPPPRFDRFRRPYRGSVPNALRPIMHAWRTGGMRSPVISDADRDHLVDLYDGSILFMDSLLATLLGALEGLGLGPTYVIVTSDHGEEFLEHRLLGHGLTLYEEVLRVPLVIRGPGIAAGRRTEALAGLVDLVPTSLDLLGLPIPAELAGRSLRPLWEGNDDPWPERTLLLRTSFINGKGVRLGVRSSDAKLVVDPGRGHRVFFDLRRDPAEGEGRPQGPGAQRLASRLEGVDPARAGQPVALSGDEVEQLRALGYMDAPAAPPTPAP